MSSNKRIESLDVFRGLTVALMILVEYVACSSFAPEILRHAWWNGLTFADLVFPSFLFIVGISMAYSLKKRSSQDTKTFWKHFIFRVIALFLIGVFINWLYTGLSLEAIPSLRIMGVLQLIALSSLFAAFFAFLKPKWILVAGIIFVIIHSCLLLFVSFPGVVPGLDPNGLSPGLTIDDWIDFQILTPTHMFNPNTDPEGILSIIPATAMVLFGLVLGKTLQTSPINSKNISKYLGLGGLIIAIGALISIILPVNKTLWTSSFVLITTGLGIIVMTILYYYLDVHLLKNPRKSLLKLAAPLGRNALIVYVLSIIMCILMVTRLFNAQLNSYSVLNNFFSSIIGPVGSSVLIAILIVLFWGVIAYILDYKKIYIKL
ncbi:MAG: acyltransferase family protein [Methanobacteriaceae archaeon]